jgi:hypothetical protein
MLTISSHEGNANPNHIDSTSLLTEELPSRTQTTTNIDQDVGKNEPSYTTGGNLN